MSDENQIRIKAEIDSITQQRLRIAARDEYCRIKAATLHSRLPYVTQKLVSEKVLEYALLDDWAHREALYRSPHLHIASEDLLMHLLENPSILEEPEILFLSSLIKLEHNIRSGG